MAEFYEVKIDDFWLTKDGTEQAEGSGNRIMCLVDGVDKLLGSDYTKSRFKDFRGNPILQFTHVEKRGREIVITMDHKLPAVTGAMITALHRSSDLAKTPFRLQGSDGDGPAWDVMVLPDGDDAFDWAKFDGFGNYIGAILRYITTGPGA